MRSFGTTRGVAAKALAVLALGAALPSLLGITPAGAGATDSVVPRFTLEGSVKFVVVMFDPLPYGFKNMASAVDQITYASAAVQPYVKPNGAVKWYGTQASEYREYTMVDGQHSWRAVPAATAIGNGERLQVLGHIVPVPGDGFLGRPFGELIRLGAFPPVDQHLEFAVSGVSSAGTTYTGRSAGPDFEGAPFTFTGTCNQSAGAPEVDHSGTFVVGDPGGDSISGSVVTSGGGHRGIVTGGTGAYAGASGASSFVWRLATCAAPSVLGGVVDVDLF